jgi:peptidoglycan/xylan/chitin deacetylase (PgdA/CDA1 family)
MITSAQRVERRRAERARLRRQRYLAALVAIVLAGGGAAAIAVFATGGVGGSRRVALPVRPRIGYVGAKLPPQPASKPRRGALPSLAEQQRAVQRLVKLGLPILCGGHRGRYIALTFDDGPGPYTKLAMHILRKRHMRATFFLVGFRVQLYPTLPVREARFGALGDHTWTHAFLPKLSTPAILQQIRATREIVERTSRRQVLVFRPPYGAHNAKIDRIVRSLGLLEVLWSVDSGDSTGADVRGVYRNVLAGLKPGAIILMHENRATTIKSLIHHVLPEIQRRHLKPVSVPELLALDPPSAAQVRNRRC